MEENILVTTVLTVEADNKGTYRLVLTVGDFPNRKTAGIYASELLGAKDAIMQDNQDMVIDKRKLN